MTFVVWGIIQEVKSDANFENDICKRIAQRLGEVFVGFNVDVLFFSKDFQLFQLQSCWVLGIVLGVKK